MRIGVSSSGRWWVSMGPLGWLLTWLLVSPFIAVWLLLWVTVRGVAWLARRLHGAPALPARLRTPPRRP